MSSSSVEDEVMRIRKQFEKMTSEPDTADQSQALDLLKTLSRLKINLNVLTTTRIGMTVNALRKSSSDDEVIAMAKSLIKTWKKFVPESAEKKEKKKEEKEKSKEDKNGAEDDQSAAGLSSGADGDKGNASFPPRPQHTSDQMRLKCREMLTNALRGEREMPEGVFKPVEEIGELVEDAIFNKCGNTGMKYKNQLRSRVFNLKDKKNPELRDNVLCGVILPEKFASMTTQEMASDDVKSQRQAFIKSGIDSAQLAHVEGTKTDLLTCGKCKKKNCTYNQLQTRSADEPMTTFVVCNECGNRWKFC